MEHCKHCGASLSEETEGLYKYSDSAGNRYTFCGENHYRQWVKNNQ